MSFVVTGYLFVAPSHDLETLELSHNIDLTELPREMANLKRLTYLYPVSYTHLTLPTIYSV